jgi:RimJ/RimL family protein N-acetyltransferase
LHKLKLAFQDGNIGSQRVAEKCGFKFEGRFVKERIRDGKYFDLVYYSLFREDCEK